MGLRQSTVVSVTYASFPFPAYETSSVPQYERSSCTRSLHKIHWGEGPLLIAGFDQERLHAHF